MRRVLDEAAGRLDRASRPGGALHGQPAVEAATRTAVGRTYLGLGAPELAEPHLERAYQLMSSLPVGPGAARGEATDALALLAEAAGYKDPELWWEQQIERRANATGLFEAIQREVP